MDFTINEPTIISGDCSSVAEDLSCLFKHKWKVYYSSLFDVDAQKFQQQCLAMNRRLNDVNKQKNRCIHKTHLTLCPELRLSEEMSQGLKVEVVLNDSEVLYRGYFLNWSECIEEKTHLPLLLVNSKRKIAEVVHAALADTLFCTIREVDFNHNSLVTLFAALINVAEKNEEKKASLKYQLPGLVDSDAITISFPAKDIAIIFKFYRENIDDQDAIEFFYDKFLAHIQNTFSLDLSCATVAEVDLPDSFARKDGLIQFKSPLSAQVVLTAIQGIFFEDLHLTNAPALSIPSGSS